MSESRTEPQSGYDILQITLRGLEAGAELVGHEEKLARFTLFLVSLSGHCREDWVAH